MSKDVLGAMYLSIVLSFKQFVGLVHFMQKGVFYGCVLGCQSPSPNFDFLHILNRIGGLKVEVFTSQVIGKNLI